MLNIISTKQWTFLILEEGGQFDSHKSPLLKQPGLKTNFVLSNRHNSCLG